jgi:hypothetical protein
LQIVQNNYATSSFESLATQSLKTFILLWIFFLF